MNENVNMENMEVTELLEMLYNSVAEAWGVPLGKDKCMIHREGTLNLLEDIRAQLPIELSEARRLLAAKEEFIANAKREADSIRKAAEEEARRLVDEQEVMQVARTRANELKTNAEQKGRDIIRAANEYVDDALRRTEDAIAAALSEVKGSRVRFRGVAGAAANAPVSEIRTIDDDDMDK